VALNSHAPKVAAALIIRNGCLSFDLAFAATLWAFFVLHVTSPSGRWLLSHHLAMFVNEAHKLARLTAVIWVVLIDAVVANIKTVISFTQDVSIIKLCVHRRLNVIESWECYAFANNTIFNIDNPKLIL